MTSIKTTNAGKAQAIIQKQADKTGATAAEVKVWVRALAKSENLDKAAQVVVKQKVIAEFPGLSKLNNLTNKQLWTAMSQVAEQLAKSTGHSRPGGGGGGGGGGGVE